jgi:hypothetical protein
MIVLDPNYNFILIVLQESIITKYYAINWYSNLYLSTTLFTPKKVTYKKNAVILWTSKAFLDPLICIKNVARFRIYLKCLCLKQGWARRPSKFNSKHIARKSHFIHASQFLYMAFKSCFMLNIKSHFAMYLNTCFSHI